MTPIRPMPTARYRAWRQALLVERLAARTVRDFDAVQSAMDRLTAAHAIWLSIEYRPVAATPSTEVAA